MIGGESDADEYPTTILTVSVLLIKQKHAGDESVDICRALDATGAPTGAARSAPAMPATVRYATPTRKGQDPVVSEVSLLQQLLQLIAVRCSTDNLVRLCGAHTTTNPLESEHHRNASIAGKHLANGIGHGYAGMLASGTLRQTQGWGGQLIACNGLQPWPTYIGALRLFQSRDRENKRDAAYRNDPANRAARKRKGAAHLPRPLHIKLSEWGARDFDAAAEHERDKATVAAGHEAEKALPEMESRLLELEALKAAMLPGCRVWALAELSGKYKLQASDKVAATGAQLAKVARALGYEGGDATAQAQQRLEAGVKAAGLVPRDGDPGTLTALLRNPLMVGKQITSARARVTSTKSRIAGKDTCTDVRPAKRWCGEMRSLDSIAAAVIASQAGGAVEQYGGGKHAQRKAAKARASRRGKGSRKGSQRGSQGGCSLKCPTARVRMVRATTVGVRIVQSWAGRASNRSPTRTVSGTSLTNRRAAATAIKRGRARHK